MSEREDFFLRYYIGHKGAYGHEYLDFEVDARGKLKYLNNSEYKSDSLISKEGTIFSYRSIRLRNSHRVAEADRKVEQHSFL